MHRCPKSRSVLSAEDRARISARPVKSDRRLSSSTGALKTGAGARAVVGGYYWKVIISVRLSVGAFGFKGSLARLPLP
jgi:hypothetical protein